MVVYQLIHNLSTQTCGEIDILPFTQAFATKAEAEKRRREILSSLKALANANKATVKENFECTPAEYMKYAGFRISIVKHKVTKEDLIRMISSIPCGEYQSSIQYVRNHDAAVVAVWDDIPKDDPLAHQGLSWTLYNDNIQQITAEPCEDEVEESVL